MLAPSSIPSPDPSVPPCPLLAAIVYPNEFYPQVTFQRIVAACRARKLRIAGVLQHPASDDPAHRCDVVLENLTTGERTDLFENRGTGAKGCRLDIAALTDITARIESALDQQPDLLLLNKFGKVEAEGGGLIDPIAIAIDRGIPVMIGVPERNLAAWRAFAGSMAIEFSPNAPVADALLEVLCPATSLAR